MVNKQAVRIIFDRVKPLFVEHEGDFEVQEITDDGIIKVKLIGQCQLCIYKEKTRRAIETMLKNEVPGIKGLKLYREDSWDYTCFITCSLNTAGRG